MEIRKFNYEILDFGNGEVFRAENDDQKEHILEELVDSTQALKEVAEEALGTQAQEAVTEKKEEVQELPPEPSFSKEEMEVAKSLAKEEGMREGAAQAKKESEDKADKLQESIAKLLAAINSQVSTHVKSSEDKFKAIEKSYTGMALAVAKKIVGGKQTQEIESEIADSISDTFEKIGKKEGLSLIVNPATADAVRDSFEGVKIVEDEAILPNDFKIKWHNGFAQRKTDEIWKDIEQILNTGDIAKPEIKQEDGEVQNAKELKAEAVEAEPANAEQVKPLETAEAKQEIIEGDDKTNEEINNETKNEE